MNTFTIKTLTLEMDLYKYNKDGQLTSTGQKRAKTSSCSPLYCIKYNLHLSIISVDHFKCYNLPIK